jgi:O-antigen ligase
VTRRLWLAASSPELLVALAALFAALLVGALTAADVPLGLGLLMGLCYAPLVLLNLPVGLAIWVGVVFIENLPALSIGPNAAGILIALGWFGTIGVRREAIGAIFRAHRKLIGAGALLLVWLSLSAVWAADAGMTLGDVWQWYLAGLLLVIVATTVSTPRHAYLIVGGFVVGATLSVTIGIFSGDLTSSATALDTASAVGGRLPGGGRDPNYLAAGLVPAFVLAGALLTSARGPILRWAIVMTMGLLGLGLAATESRGGLIAAGVALVAVLLVSKRKSTVLATIAVILVGGAGWFATSPSAWHRISDFNGGGTGRTELWTVGWRIYQQHPALGIGLNNFRVESNRFVRRPGRLEFVRLISERPDLVHNAYLQLLVEAGPVGLALFLGVIGACLRAAWMAARRFEALGERGLSDLARGVLVACIGMLAASFFLSNGADKRLWTILALGPALLGIAARAQGQAPASPSG